MHYEDLLCAAFVSESALLGLALLHFVVAMQPAFTIHDPKAPPSRDMIVRSRHEQLFEQLRQKTVAQWHVKKDNMKNGWSNFYYYLHENSLLEGLVFGSGYHDNQKGEIPQEMQLDTMVSFCHAYALTAVCSGLHYEVCLARIALLVTTCLGIDHCTLRFALCSCCFKKCIVRLCFVAAQNT